MYKVKYSIDGLYKSYGSFECKMFVYGTENGRLKFWTLQTETTESIQGHKQEIERIIAYKLNKKPIIHGEDVVLSVDGIQWFGYPIEENEVPAAIHNSLRGME